MKSQKSFYELSAKLSSGEPFAFSSLKGKKVMIVNTASECGFTPQYAQLQELYMNYESQGFVILGFPSNDFGGQEPGTNEEIQTFCKQNFGVTFPIMEKSKVVGDGMHPVYQWLTSKSENGMEDSKVTWNFQKYLIAKDGSLERMLTPSQSPLDELVINWLKG